MKKLTKKQKEDIANILQERGATLPCPRCGRNEFFVSDGYFVQSVQIELTGTVLGGSSIPSIVIVCKNCGYLSQHALGRLGLLPKKKDRHE